MPIAAHTIARATTPSGGAAAMRRESRQSAGSARRNHRSISVRESHDVDEEHDQVQADVRENPCPVDPGLDPGVEASSGHDLEQLKHQTAAVEPREGRVCLDVDPMYAG